MIVTPAAFAAAATTQRPLVDAAVASQSEKEYTRRYANRVLQVLDSFPKSQAGG
jgi:hypothetical protein